MPELSCYTCGRGVKSVQSVADLVGYTLYSHPEKSGGVCLGGQFLRRKGQDGEVQSFWRVLGTKKGKPIVEKALSFAQ